MVQSISNMNANVGLNSATAKTGISKSFANALEQASSNMSSSSIEKENSEAEKTLEEASSALKKAASGITACNKCGAIYIGSSLTICTKCGNDMSKKEDNADTKVESINGAQAAVNSTAAPEANASIAGVAEVSSATAST